MDALDLSAALVRRSDELRARSARARAVAAQRHATAAQLVEKSRRLIAAAAQAQEDVLPAHRGERAGRAVAPVGRQG